MSNSEYNKLMEEWNEVTEEMNKLEERVPELAAWRDLLLRRRTVVSQLKPICATMAFENPKEKGMLDVGPFTFSKTYKTSFNMEAMAENEDCFKALVENDLVKIGELVAPKTRESFELALNDPYMTVKMDESKLKSLVDAGELKLPDNAIVKKQATPTQKKGPKEDFYA
jgi:hypothetical protein